MSNGIKFKEAFEVESKHTAFYTGGNIEWHSNLLYCQTPSTINLLDTQSGNVTKSIGNETPNEDPDTIQTFTSDSQTLITAHKSGLLKLWTLDGQLTKTWKHLHKGPIAKLCLEGPKLATGGSDGTVRIWDLALQTCSLSLKGAQGVVNVVKFSPPVEGGEGCVFASGDDGKILKWELTKGGLEATFSAHFSKVIEVVFFHDGTHFASLGRDKVVVLWGLQERVALKTVPLFEAVESLVALPKKFRLPSCKSSPDGLYVCAGGENGRVKVWELFSAKEVYVQTSSLVSPAKEQGGLAITRVLFKDDTKELAVVTSEHNIIVHNLKTFVCLKQFVGFSDEILDVIYFGKDDTHIVVATNSTDIKLYENSTMNCQLLKGHTDIVLSLDKSTGNPNLLLSSSKDNSIRLWHMQDGDVKCVGVGTRHTNSVGSAAFSHSHTPFAVSVSQDTCLKVWETPKDLTACTTLTCTHTDIAHHKDINCVSVSPNDKIIATGSQDKTAKLWTDSLTLLGTLRGHKRGVWNVRFSPVDQVVATSSADCSVKLWSITDLSCLKTLEGHESSVLRVEFLANGMQVLSAGADGMLKIFSVKTSECEATFDEHEGRVWALAVKGDETGLVTGDSESCLLKWKDVTEERKLEKVKELEEYVIEEQKLQNYLQNDDLLGALKLALRLNRPLKVLRIIQSVVKCGKEGLTDTVKELRDDQKESLLKCASVWNTNSKNCLSAQLIINILVNEFQAGTFKRIGLENTLEGMLPYTERHFRRLTQLFQDLHFVRYTVDCMQPHAKSVE